MRLEQIIRDKQGESGNLVISFENPQEERMLAALIYELERPKNLYTNDLPVRRCRECGCTNQDFLGCYVKTGGPCSWVEKDLCSACVPEQPAKKVPREPKVSPEPAQDHPSRELCIAKIKSGAPCPREATDGDLCKQHAQMRQSIGRSDKKDSPDWPKILDAARDVLSDQPEGLNGRELMEEMGYDPKGKDSTIYSQFTGQMKDDDRFLKVGGGPATKWRLTDAPEEQVEDDQCKSAHCAMPAENNGWCEDCNEQRERKAKELDAWSDIPPGKDGKPYKIREAPARIRAQEGDA